ncbi:hypothetical protein Pelo_14456 [Pelomyxa schiedti]|nr:hypothetical protein Pelo_14456 [Pelomyxa schiedti]
MSSTSGHVFAILLLFTVSAAITTRNQIVSRANGLDPVCDTTREWRDELWDKVKSTLAQQKYEVVDEGTYYWTYEASYGGNTQSMYGVYSFPERGLGKNGTAWMLKENEAIIFIGCTPPEARYFSWQSYTLTTPGTTVLTSWDPLGDSLNQLVLDTTGGSYPFSATMAVITTGDRNTESAIRQAFVKNGFPNVNTDIMPGQVLSYGLIPPADTFEMINRVAGFSDSEEGNYYLQTKAPVYLVRPPNAQEVMLYGIEPSRPTATGLYEQDRLTDSVEQLKLQVEDYWLTQGFSLKHYESFSASQLNWTACVLEDIVCAGASADALYAHPPSLLANLTFGPTDDDSQFFIVLGVSHYISGWAMYTSLAVYDDSHTEVAGVFDTGYYGSAALYEPPSIPYDDQLYVERISRVCGSEENFCITITTDEIPEGEEFSITARSYLNPTSKTAPDAGEMIHPLLMHFVRS